MKKWNKEQFLNNVQLGSKVPLHLWGIGNVANEVYVKLREDEIEIDGVFETVYRESYRELLDEKKIWNGYEVKKWNELVEEGHRIDVILGHAQYHQGVELEKSENVRCVYYIYSPFKTHQTIDISYYNKHYTEYSNQFNKALH